LPSQSLPEHVSGLLKYLAEPNEKANEDLALGYFRRLYGDAFQRQKDAYGADGYVAGSLILELKGKTNDWLSGLFQALAYQNVGCDFGQIVVAAKHFLAIWRVNEIDEAIREEVISATGAPNQIGKRFAKKYASRKKKFLECATWNASELSGSLFLSNPKAILNIIKSFERSLHSGKRVRLKITPANFVDVLKSMKQFFDPSQPVKTVRAFYSMVYAWSETSTVILSNKASDQAALGGEQITDLIPSQRLKFKAFAENYYIDPGPNGSVDDFFARYDAALDAVDKHFRVKHGVFFTDPYLSKFIMWLVKQRIPDLGRNYLVIDPACGSGNLVTNWRSPLELRHKVVSEIEPELLFAVERRMKGDQWHNGKFTVVPKVSEGKGLNFLDQSASAYLDILRKYLKEKGQRPDKPLAFLCNPPYRSDDDQAAAAISYAIHPSIIEMTGSDASSERYCCFLAQMKLMCEAAVSRGLPGESLLLLFTKSAWLTQRSVFSNIRSAIFGSFKDELGVLVNGAEFFDVKGKWPVAFTLWRHVGEHAGLDSTRSIPLVDLTSLTRDQLVSIPWEDQSAVEPACRALLNQEAARWVEVGRQRESIQKWVGQTMTDFKRDRRKSEQGKAVVGGLPSGDLRQGNKKTYGESDGKYIGFMDELTPCRVRKSTPNRPWFYLDTRFMSIKKARCLSGPPTHLGYCATHLDPATKLFFWYALARTFLQVPYPMWIDADNMWKPDISEELRKTVYQTAIAIGYAENECLETAFPANNPIAGVPEIVVNNPLTPLSPDSFWNATLKPYCSGTSAAAKKLIRSVDDVFKEWGALIHRKGELFVSGRPYLLRNDPLPLGSGLVQIRDYAREVNNDLLLDGCAAIQVNLKALKAEFSEMLSSSEGMNYFGVEMRKQPASVENDLASTVRLHAQDPPPARRSQFLRRAGL
jgi:hypothetical protein